MILKKVINFEINQRLVHIVEIKDPRYVFYISQLLEAKMAQIFIQIKHGVSSSSAPSQQGGDKIANVVLTKLPDKDQTKSICIKGSYVVPKLINGSNAPKIQIGIGQ